MNRWAIIGGACVMLIIVVGGWLLFRKGSTPSEPKTLRLEVPVEEPKESILATYEGLFRCTLYYSPRESGFTKEGGFDLTPETKPGLEAKRYSRDFLRAVEMEGFGKLTQPVDGKSYIRYWSKKWGFIEQPVDHHQRPLVAKQTCAIAKPHALVTHDAKLSIRCQGVPMEFNNLRWRVSDTGSGLGTHQLDLYWEEDDPLGPGKKLSRPKGFEGELVNPTIMVVADAQSK